MSRQKIDHRYLLEHVLPLAELPGDIQAATSRALESDDPVQHEAATRRAIDALVAAGVLAPGTPEAGSERYVNRETGDTLTVRWSEPEPPVVKLSIPTGTHAGRVSLDIVHELLTLDEELFRSDTTSPASLGDIVRSSLAVLTKVIGADFVTFVPVEADYSVELGGPARDASRHVAVIQRFLEPRESAVVYLSDARVEPALLALAPSADFASVVIAAVGGDDRHAPLRGYLQAWSRRPGFLSHDGLVTASLFADQLTETLRKATVLERLVYYDALTGLYNRHFFNVQMKTEMARARRAGHSFALAIVDLDDFKSVNTRFGYYGGNDLLVQVAQVLKGQIRPFDIAARWGGEEFGLILTPPVVAHEAISVCNRLREAVASHPHTVSGLDLAKHDVTLSLSIGVALFPDDGETGKRLWTAANTALGIAKTQGKNRVVYHGEGRHRRHDAPPERDAAPTEDDPTGTRGA